MVGHFFSIAIVCPWLDFGLPPRCPLVVWCHGGEIGPFSATWLGIEPGQRGGQTVSYPTELS